MAADRIKATLCRPFLTFFGYDTGGMRRMTQRNREHFICRSHFQVERQVYAGTQAGDILIRHMTPVFTQMCGNTVCPRRGGSLRRAHRIRMLPAARVPDRRDMIDINAKSQISLFHRVTRSDIFRPPRGAVQFHGETLLRVALACHSANSHADLNLAHDRPN